MEYAYKLVLDANQRMNWKIKLDNGQTRTYHKDAQMKWYKRTGMKMISWLPIEGFM